MAAQAFLVSRPRLDGGSFCFGPQFELLFIAFFFFEWTSARNRVRSVLIFARLLLSLCSQAGRCKFAVGPRDGNGRSFVVLLSDVPFFFFL